MMCGIYEEALKEFSERVIKKIREGHGYNDYSYEFSPGVNAISLVQKMMDCIGAKLEPLVQLINRMTTANDASKPEEKKRYNHNNVMLIRTLFNGMYTLKTIIDKLAPPIGAKLDGQLKKLVKKRAGGGGQIGGASEDVIALLEECILIGNEYNTLPLERYGAGWFEHIIADKEVERVIKQFGDEMAEWNDMLQMSNVQLRSIISQILQADVDTLIPKDPLYYKRTYRKILKHFFENDGAKYLVPLFILHHQNPQDIRFTDILVILFEELNIDPNMLFLKVQSLIQQHDIIQQKMAIPDQSTLWPPPTPHITYGDPSTLSAPSTPHITYGDPRVSLAPHTYEDLEIEGVIMNLDPNRIRHDSNYRQFLSTHIGRIYVYFQTPRWSIFSKHLNDERKKVISESITAYQTARGGGKRSKRGTHFKKNKKRTAKHHKRNKTKKNKR